jgi:hypothetical protein
LLLIPASVDNRSAEGYGGNRASSLPALSGLLN